MKMGSLATPAKYFQGEGLLDELSKYARYLGDTFAVVADQFVLEIIEEKIRKSFMDSDASVNFFLFEGETTHEQAENLYAKIKDKNCDVVIGVGGGKTIDTAKLISHMSDMPLVIVPTVASSDAPCSSITVVYREDGTFLEAVKLKKNPDMVLIDTGIIARAPVRTLLAGIGDAFSTFYEARACKESGTLNFNGGNATNAGFALTVLCKDLLLEYGEEARRAVENGVCNEALEKVVEANIYLSGVGFENNGCAIAHAFYSGLTTVIRPLSALHGEAVALGTMIQLLAEGVSDEELEPVVSFYKRVGLPLSFKDLGIETITQGTLYKIAEATCTTGKNAHHMPFPVTPDLIMNAMAKLLQINGQ